LGYLRKPHLRLHGWMNLTYGQPMLWSHRNIEYRSDEHGFRNPLGSRQADVVFIGDSFTEAPQVAEEETFARQIEDRTISPSSDRGWVFGPMTFHFPTRTGTG